MSTRKAKTYWFILIKQIICQWQCWRRKFFFRRQSESSLIVGRIIDPRPGLRALLMDPFVTHWCTIYPSLHVVLLRPRVERWTICFAMPKQIYLQTCFSCPKILKNCYCESVKLYIPIQENLDKITSVQKNTGRFKATIKTT
jgi:hypothetical protein